MAAAELDADLLAVFGAVDNLAPDLAQVFYPALLLDITRLEQTQHPARNVFVRRHPAKVVPKLPAALLGQLRDGNGIPVSRLVRILVGAVDGSDGAGAVFR